MTPNLLARTIETVEGGGLIVFLLQSLTSLKQLYTFTMDVHERFRTEAHQEVVARFNERYLLPFSLFFNISIFIIYFFLLFRFMLSLVSCNRCLVVYDQLTVLPISSKVLDLVPEEKTNNQSVNDIELAALKENMKDTQPVGCLVNCCKTVDQVIELIMYYNI